MIAVWYDPDCDEIWITDEDRSYARRSLVSFIDPATGKIGIRLKEWVGADIVMTAYTNLMDRAGLGFLSAVEAKAYLDGEFAKQRPAGLPPITFTAGQPLSGHRAVRLAGSGAVRFASADDITQAGLVAGVTLHAAEEGEPVAVAIVGEVVEPSWSFAPGPVFLGLNGALVQAPPASGFVQPMGTAITPTRLIVERGTPIILAQ